MFHHLYPQRKKRGSVLICLLSNAWVGDSFKLLTVITHTRMHTNTHTYTQHDRCLQHYVVSCICVYLCVWALSCVHPNVCVCVCVSCIHVSVTVCLFVKGEAWLTQWVQNKREMRRRSNNEGMVNIERQMSGGRREGWRWMEKLWLCAQMDFLFSSNHE